jgi:transmembrane sensor
MVDLDARLQRGPLKVGSLWTPDRPALVARRALCRRRRIAVSVGACLACACVAVLFIVPRRHGAAPASSAVAASEVRFADGSGATLLARNAEVRVQEDTVDRVVARLTGSARFDVVSNPRRTFEVRAGDVRVRVLGTAFSLRQIDSAKTHVSVEHGRVQVAWMGGAVTLRDGEQGLFPPPAGAETGAADSGAAPELAAPAGPAGPGVRQDHGWRESALRGDFDRAYAELNARGKDDVRDDPSDLMLAADVARLSSHPAQAALALQKVCDRYPKDRRAPVAAFTLGRVLLDDLGRGTEAAAAFHRARVLWPAGPLAQDALAREAEALQHAGSADRARSVADQYLRGYPEGRHAAAMRNMLKP